ATSPHDQLSDIQRARIIAATVDVVCESGAANATVARVVARAGVSRRTFYELFPDREAYDPQVRWAERLRSSLAALLAFLDMKPEVGWLLIVGSLGAGPRALEQRGQVLARMIAFVDEGRQAGKRGEDPPPLTAEGLAGGVFSLIHARMVDESPAPLTELLPALMSMVVLPYLGPAAARRELARPAPPARNGRPARSADPLRELDMRLTYRTIRVLLAIGERGGEGMLPSNRRW